MRLHPAACALAALALAALPAPALADRLQPAADAARTGAPDEPGPAWPDVAWQVRIPAASVVGSPVVVGTDIYVVATARPFVPGETGPSNLTRNALFRLSVDRGEPVEIATIDDLPSGLASDGAQLIVRTANDTRAYSFDGGPPKWRFTYPLAADAQPYVCADPAAHAGSVIIACRSAVREPSVGISAGTQAGTLAAWRLDAVTGRPLWTWTKALNETCQPPTPVAVPRPPCPLDAAPGAGSAGNVAGVAVSDEMVVVLADRAPGAGTTPAAYALSMTDGHQLWRRDFVGLESADASTWAVHGDIVAPAPPVIAGDHVYVLWRSLVALDPRTGEVLWRNNMVEDPAPSPNQERVIGVRGGAVYASSPDGLHRVDAASRVPRWSYMLGSERWWGEIVFTTPRWVIVPAFNEGDTAFGLRAIDPETGGEAWRHQLQSGGSGRFNIWTFAMTREGIVAAGYDGQVVMLGRVATSMPVRVAVSDRYPAPGAPMSIDLSTTGPGLSGAPNAFRVAWGDGDETEWQSSPFFTHTYPSPGLFAPRFFARNEANETASAVETIEVGGHEPTFLEDAFSADRQNTTFFVLGLALTAAGGLFGVVRYRRRHLVLRREMRDLEADYARLRASPLDCERALTARRARYRDLLVRGKLDDGTYGILERRVEEHARDLRLGVIHQRLAFLPYGMVEQLRALLQDGRISAWERSHFLDALARESSLTSEQKDRVRALIDEWTARDAGA